MALVNFLNISLGMQGDWVNIPQAKEVKPKTKCKKEEDLQEHEIKEP